MPVVVSVVRPVPVGRISHSFTPIGASDITRCTSSMSPFGMVQIKSSGRTKRIRVDSRTAYVRP